MDTMTALAIAGLAMGMIYFLAQMVWDRHKWKRERAASIAREQQMQTHIANLARQIAEESAVALTAISQAEEQKRLQETLAKELNDRERYLRIMIHEHSELNIQGLKTRCPTFISLRDVYIPVRVRVKPADLSPRTPRQINSDDFDKEDLESFRIREGRDIAMGGLFHLRPRISSSSHDLCQYARLVLVGGPGAGKSTFVQYAVLAFANGTHEAMFGLRDNFLPIPIRLREVPIEMFGTASLADVAYHLSDRKGYSIPLEFYTTHLKEGRCAVFLDGLDEVPTSEDRRTVLEWLKQATASYSDNIFVLTTRPAGYPEHQLTRYVRADLDEFNYDEIVSFCEFWSRAVETALRGDTADTRLLVKSAAADLARATMAKPEVLALARNPLMLSIVCLVHRYRARLPDRRVDLYGECLDVLLEHWDAARQLPVPFPAHLALQVLQPIALQFHLLGVREMSYEDLHKALLPALARANLGGQLCNLAKRFLDVIRDRSGVLTGLGGDTYGFTHLTFQEYLTAREILNTSQEQVLVENYGSSFWREVLLLYAGMRDCTSLMSAALTKSTITADTFIITSKLLHEAVACDNNVKTQVIEHLLAVTKEITGDRPGEAWLYEIIAPNAELILGAFLQEVMLNAPSCPISRFAAWSYFRSSKVQARWPEAFDRMEHEIGFDGALKGTPEAVIGIARILLECVPELAARNLAVQAAALVREPRDGSYAGDP